MALCQNKGQIRFERGAEERRETLRGYPAEEEEDWHMCVCFEASKKARRANFKKIQMLKKEKRKRAYDKASERHLSTFNSYT